MSVLTDNTAKLRQILEKVKDLPEVPESVEQATPSISVSSGGLITASVTQEAGVVAAGTKTATRQLATKGATTITPSDAVQTAVPAGTYVTGDIKVGASTGKKVASGEVRTTNSAKSVTISPGFRVSQVMMFLHTELSGDAAWGEITYSGGKGNMKFNPGGGTGSYTPVVTITDTQITFAKDDNYAFSVYGYWDWIAIS